MYAIVIEVFVPRGPAVMGGKRSGYYEYEIEIKESLANVPAGTHYFELKTKE
jgi:hypothetical protein